MRETTQIRKKKYAAAAPPSPGETPFALHDGEPISRGEVWSAARRLAENLPDRDYVFNLCEDRYLFCLTLLAAMHRRQVCLLPPSGQAGARNDILRDYPNAYAACDRTPDSFPCPWFKVEPPIASGWSEEVEFDPRQTALIAFTSGSTGSPKPCTHTWGTFRASAAMALRSLRLEQRRLLVVSTTPPQHMYGLETSVFWPLFSELTLCDGRPFFPEDIRRLVESAPLPVLLASTPTHLRSLAMTGGNWSNLAGILSSTARMDDRLAGQLETLTGAPLREIYGSTETLSFASREPAREKLWRPYPGTLLLADDGGRTRLLSPHLTEPAWLQDVIGIEADGRFALLGRSEDMIKIGGKRASLAELNGRLTAIEGVEDGLFLVMEDERGESRLAALVVGRPDKQAIRRGLRLYLDEVFLPRTIRFVASIPRNEAGKVSKAELDRLRSDLHSLL